MHSICGEYILGSHCEWSTRGSIKPPSVTNITFSVCYVATGAHNLWAPGS